MTDADARIAALEAQVARLTAALEHPAPTSPTAAESSYDRRTLLRRGGLALAAGAVAIPALSRPAAAATGDPLVIGRPDNTASAGNVTGLTANNPNAPTLSLANTATTQDPQFTNSQLAHPSLRLVPSTADGGPDFRTAQAGDLLSSADLLWYTHVAADDVEPAATTGMVHTSAYATFTEFLGAPYRALETRRTGTTPGNAGRSLIVDTPSTAFDTGGRLRGGQTLTLDLSELVFDAKGVFGNLTVTAPDRAGYFTVYPAGNQQPETSNINYTAGQTLANFTLSQLGPSGSSPLALRIFTSQTAHVIFDVFAFDVYEYGAILPDFAPDNAARAQRSRARLSRR